MNDSQSLALAAPEDRRSAVTEHERQEYGRKTVQKAVPLRRERDEAFEPGFADLDVARRDGEHGKPSALAENPQAQRAQP